MRVVAEYPLQCAGTCLGYDGDSVVVATAQGRLHALPWPHRADPPPAAAGASAFGAGDGALVTQCSAVTCLALAPRQLCPAGRPVAAVGSADGELLLLSGGRRVAEGAEAVSAQLPQGPCVSVAVCASPDGDWGVAAADAECRVCWYRPWGDRAWCTDLRDLAEGGLAERCCEVPSGGGDPGAAQPTPLPRPEVCGALLCAAPPYIGCGCRSGHVFLLSPARGEAALCCWLRGAEITALSACRPAPPAEIALLLGCADGSLLRLSVAPGAAAAEVTTAALLSGAAAAPALPRADQLRADLVARSPAAVCAVCPRDQPPLWVPPAAPLLVASAVGAAAGAPPASWATWHTQAPVRAWSWGPLLREGSGRVVLALTDRALLAFAPEPATQA